MMYTSRHQLIKSELIMALTRPPKPPCWRDFVSVSDIKKKKHDKSRLEALEFTDLGQVLQCGPDYLEPIHSAKKVSSNKKLETKSKSPVPKDKPPKHEKGHVVRKDKERVAEGKSAAARRPKHRLHRTRSSAALKPENLESLGDMTLTLAQADPKSRKLGLHSKKSFPDYNDENHRRCMKWLESVQASQPLDDVAFLCGSGEELEIPEESVLDLQAVKVKDQCRRETTGDFLDEDALKLSPLDNEQKETHVSQSKGHRKSKHYHQRRKHRKSKDTSPSKDIEDKVAKVDNTETENKSVAKTGYTICQTVLEDIDEVISKGSDNKAHCGDLYDVSTCSSEQKDQSKNTEIKTDSTIVKPDALVSKDCKDTDKNGTENECVPDIAEQFEEEIEQWQGICETLQSYTLQNDTLTESNKDKT